MVSISYAFRVGTTTVTHIIRETCEAIWDCLNNKFLMTPNESTWLDIAQQFDEIWQLSHCTGALDGKHVVIQALPNPGSTFYNYKGSHSIVLLALCDAKYKFTLVDIGAEGRHSDGGIFKNCNIGKQIISNEMKFPPAEKITETEPPINYYIAADEAFPLSTRIMRPYARRFLPQMKRIFNYRLCRARRVIKNSFGILSSRWLIYRRPINASLPTVMAIVKATVCLHNYLISTEKQYFSSSIVDKESATGDIIDGEWRNNETNRLCSIQKVSSNMYGRTAEQMSSSLARYFVGDGAVPFQWNN